MLMDFREILGPYGRRDVLAHILEGAARRRLGWESRRGDHVRRGRGNDRRLRRAPAGAEHRAPDGNLG